MATTFDGRAYATEKIEELKIVTLGLKSRGKNPHLASILIGNDPASKLYVGLKKKAAEKIGAELDTYFLPVKTKFEDLTILIDSLNNDENVQGIMIQLPIPGKLADLKDEIIGKINPAKDVDGLGEDSHYLHPTSKAVIDIMNIGLKDVKLIKTPITVCVVGATGMVGAPLVKELKKEGFRVLEARQNTKDVGRLTLGADVVVSATGVPGIIKPGMVKNGVIVIDVGSPIGDVDPKVADKAAFITPVPGGVGPVTIACLLENLIENV